MILEDNTAHAIDNSINNNDVHGSINIDVTSEVKDVSTGVKINHFFTQSVPSFFKDDVGGFFKDLFGVQHSLDNLMIYIYSL